MRRLVMGLLLLLVVIMLGLSAGASDRRLPGSGDRGETWHLLTDQQKGIYVLGFLGALDYTTRMLGFQLGAPDTYDAVYYRSAIDVLARRLPEKFNETPLNDAVGMAILYHVDVFDAEGQLVPDQQGEEIRY